MSGKLNGSRRTGRDPDAAPEITKEWIDGVSLYRGKKPVSRGRPPGSGQKTQMTVRLSNDVLAYFRASGPGWQTRLDEALRKYVASRRR